MAVRKKSRSRRAASNGESESPARLAPPEEKKGAARNSATSDGNSANDKSTSDKSVANDGTLSVNTSELKLPQELIEDENGGSLFQQVDPAVLVILCLSLIFIAAIAYVIWSGWEPSK